MSMATVDVRTANQNVGVDAQAWAMTLVRAVVGIIFLLHGGQKLFAFGLHNVAGMMGHLGIPWPGVAAAVVSWVEFLAGAALLLGLLTRAAAFLLAFDMLVAILKVHLRNGFFLPTGFEYALTLLVLNAALIVSGAGALALDNAIFHRRK